jgi:hypothetical protein
MNSMNATSAVKFLIWLLVASSAIAILAKRLRTPYTVALVAGGLILSVLRLPPCLATRPRPAAGVADP